MRSALTSLFCLLLILIFSNTFAQNKTPGYLGKRFEFTYNLAIAPASGTIRGTRNFAGTKSGFFNGEFYLHTRHELGFQYTTSRRASIGLYFSGFRSGFVSSDYSYSNNFLDTLGQIKSRGVGIAYRRFLFLKRGNIAPIGPFTQIHYTFFRLGLFDPGSDTGEPVEQAFMGILGMYFGNNIVVTDQIMLSLGLEFNAPFLNRSTSPITASRFGSGNTRAMAEAVAAPTFINFRISINGLLF